LVSDDLWAMEPLLPVERPKPKGGRPRLPDRAALTGIMFVLVTGSPWERLPVELGCGFPALPARRRFLDSVLTGSAAELVLAGREAEAANAFASALEAGEETPAGIVHLVGAGPGAADLLTLRALRLLGEADVVVHDRLVSPEVLDCARRDAEFLYVGKARANHCVPQAEINALLVKLAREGKRVVRLKGGDPFVFGRGGEEMDALREAGIVCDVVPGITAALACAA